MFICTLWREISEKNISNTTKNMIKKYANRFLPMRILYSIRQCKNINNRIKLFYLIIRIQNMYNVNVFAYNLMY